MIQAIVLGRLVAYNPAGDLAGNLGTPLPLESGHSKPKWQRRSRGMSFSPCPTLSYEIS
jgi:hypothetical protein